jgi:hypothetical protein
MHKRKLIARGEMIMSTIASYNDALDVLPETKPETKTGSKRPDFLATIRLVAQAVHEGHVAARRYGELTARGVAHDKAARQVFAELYETR